MKNYKKVLVFIIFLQLIYSFSFNLLLAQNNPVVERVADAGVINFNGKYYMAGVFTNGGFYVSSDMVKWTGPVHVFTMNNEWTKGRSAGDNNIHAADIHYWNGVFHFFWSVNYWGLKDLVVHIGHAESNSILGPFVEPVKKIWFDDRIDAELFIDDDSTFYFYTVKFTDGNTIWGQPMSSPSKLKGEPRLIYTALPNTWEQYDNKVIEGPWVMKYRSRYYMMYNANHTSNQYGNYALGVAESDSPLGFNSGNKYPQPVVQSNLTDNPDNFRYYFTSSLSYFGNWLHTFEKPADNWTKTDFIDNSWNSGEKGFGSQEVRGSTVMRRQTGWTSPDIWVRKKFTLSPSPTEHLELLVNHTGATEIFLDGEQIYSSAGSNYATVKLTPEVIQKLKSGNNILSVHSKGGRRNAFMDVDLVDPINRPGDDILFNPGQPNIVRGPNGIEWWLVYFGIKNGSGRSQFIDRVLFNDRELTVDGPTGINTPGYHPNPTMPVFGDVFDYTGKDSLDKKWTLKTGKWQVLNTELTQSDSAGVALALINSNPASYYLFKAGIKNGSYKKGSTGILAFWADKANLLELGFNQSEHVWYSRILKAGKEEIRKNKLSGEFNYNVYHSISAYKNGSRFEIQIDDHPAPGNNILNTSFGGQGIPGLFSDKCSSAFDGVIYTPGWDEYDTHISGWNNSERGDNKTGNWTISENGISQPEEKGSFSAFKGDMLPQYEFGVQLYRSRPGQNQGDGGTAGIFPVYIDKANYLQTAVDFKNGNLVVSGKKNNTDIAGSMIPLKRLVCKYPDPKSGDGMSKVYILKGNSEISAVEIVKSVYNRGEFLVDQFDSLKVYYKNAGTWYPLNFRVVNRENTAVNKIEFDRVSADALKLVSLAADNNVHVYKLYVTEELTSNYNLRTVKLNDRVIVFLDGIQIAEIKESWPASQVGLMCKDMKVQYNGITLFEK